LPHFLVPTAAPLFAAQHEVHVDAVITWNRITLKIIQDANTPPPLAARNLAIVHTAIYDSVNAIERTHEIYHADIAVPSPAVPDAAAVAAAYQTLLHLYPAYEEVLSGAYEEMLGIFPDIPEIHEGIRVGNEAANSIVSWRASDIDIKQGTYEGQGAPGFWEPTPPDYLQPLYPGWGSLPSFSKVSLQQFIPSGPPSLTSARYAEELEEVRLLGAADSTHRTEEQTLIAHFWEDGPGTFTPPGHWNVIAQNVSLGHGLTLVQNARLFALLNIAQADASILCWETKYQFDLWRPVTAIRKADTDGNPATTQDPDWMPLLVTPPFPEYTSGHSTFSGAAGAILASFFGDDTPFIAYDIRNPKIQRTFTSFSQAAEEAMVSRLYGGIHFRSGNEHGLTSGQQLGTHIAHSMLQPLNTTTSEAVTAAYHDTTAPTAPVTAQTGAGIGVLLLSLLLGSGGIIAVRRLY
jgi:hypothetical protein